MCKAIASLFKKIMKKILPIIALACLAYAAYVLIFAEAGALTIAQAGLSYFPDMLATTAIGQLSPAVFAAVVAGAGIVASPSTVAQAASSVISAGAQVVSGVVSSVAGAIGSIAGAAVQASGLGTLAMLAIAGGAGYLLYSAAAANEPRQPQARIVKVDASPTSKEHP